MDMGLIVVLLPSVFALLVGFVAGWAGADRVRQQVNWRDLYDQQERRHRNDLAARERQHRAELDEATRQRPAAVPAEAAR